MLTQMSTGVSLPLILCPQLNSVLEMAWPPHTWKPWLITLPLEKTPWGILGGDEGNSFLEPVPEDVGPQRRQGHGNQAKEPHEASWGLPEVTGAT